MNSFWWFIAGAAAVFFVAFVLRMIGEKEVSLPPAEPMFKEETTTTVVTSKPEPFVPTRVTIANAEKKIKKSKPKKAKVKL